MVLYIIETVLMAHMLFKVQGEPRLCVFVSFKGLFFSFNRHFLPGKALSSVPFSVATI